VAKTNPRHGGYYGYIFGIGADGKQEQMIGPTFATKAKASYWLNTAKLICKRTGFKIQTARIDESYGPTPKNPPITHGQIIDTQKKRYAKRRKYTGASAQDNPPPTLIYGKILEVRAQKTQPHICDAKCKASGHRYVHRFTSGAQIVGLSNGDVLIKSKKG
jgi:hypothetical protein